MRQKGLTQEQKRLSQSHQKETRKKDTGQPACEGMKRTKINDDSKIATRLISLSKSVLNKKNGEKSCGQMGSNDALGREEKERKSTENNQGWKIQAQSNPRLGDMQSRVFTQHWTEVFKGKADEVT